MDRDSAETGGWVGGNEHSCEFRLSLKGSARSEIRRIDGWVF